MARARSPRKAAPEERGELTTDAESGESVEAADLVDGVTSHDVANPSDAESLPDSEIDGEHGSSLDDLAGDGLDSGLGPTDQFGDDGLDPDTIDDLDDLDVSQEGVGGLDGRGFDGGGSSNLGEPGYNDGLEDRSAAGKLPDHHQANMDRYNDLAQEAARNGNWDEAARIANEAANYMRVDVNGLEPLDFEAMDAAAGEAATPAPSTGYEGVTSLGQYYQDRKQVWDSEKGEMVWVDGDQEIDHTSAKGWDGAQTIEMKMNAPEGGTTKAPPSTEDQDESAGLEGADPWRDFTDAYLDGRREALGGADVDPGPDGDFGVAADFEEVDYEGTVAQYEQGAVVPVYEVDGEFPEPDLTPDEEFYDV